MTCSSFGAEAADLADQIASIAAKDPEPLNRVRAAEYLALYATTDPKPVIMQALTETQSEIVILEILNTIALLKDVGSPYAFPINPDMLDTEIEWNEVQSRIKYLEEI
jgi:hypothetical protein